MTKPWTPELGAQPTPEGVRFRVWAPAASAVEVDLEFARVPLQPAGDGLWQGLVAGARAGMRYRYRLDGGDSFPDPYSRSQPEGPHGPSEIVDPAEFEWHDADWRGTRAERLAIYQCHVGTATPEGTFDALIAQLPRLRDLGVTAIEPLPVAEFPGTRNWGYDGVNLFAPTRVYGGPAALKRFIDAAHQLGLAVILDVVYNHLGPDGNFLRAYAAEYFTDRYHTPWGEAINYDGPRSKWVRRLVLDNARYWLHEFHADGLRLDATHAIVDRSTRHILSELSSTVRASLAPGRDIVLIAETHENDVRYLRPLEEGGFGFDAVWADDFHHAVRRYVAGDHEGYFADFSGTLEEVARTIAQGWLYEGQHTRANEARGTVARDRPPHQFVLVLQNHDQVGNRPFGDRLHHQVDLELYRAASTLWLFLPFTPMLFMGQEFAASSPFQYFTDHHPELGRLVTEGRRREFQAFSAFADPEQRERIPDPQDPLTFERSKLPLEEIDRSPGADVFELYRALLALRRTDPVLADQDRRRMRAFVPHPDVLAVRRWRGDDERLLIANFGQTAYTFTDTAAKYPRPTAAPASDPPSSEAPASKAPGSEVPARALPEGGAVWRVSLASGPGVETDGCAVRVPPRTAVIVSRSP